VPGRERDRLMPGREKDGLVPGPQSGRGAWARAHAEEAMGSSSRLWRSSAGAAAASLGREASLRLLAGYVYDYSGMSTSLGMCLSTHSVLYLARGWSCSWRPSQSRSHPSQSRGGEALVARVSPGVQVSPEALPRSHPSPVVAEARPLLPAGIPRRADVTCCCTSRTARDVHRDPPQDERSSLRPI
jgi:hypothetical protein